MNILETDGDRLLAAVRGLLEQKGIVSTAEVQERDGEFAAAAQSFQDAVTLDETRGEPQAAASDWFNYGQFLRRQAVLPAAMNSWMSAASCFSMRSSSGISRPDGRPCRSSQDIGSNCQDLWIKIFSG